MKVGKVSRKIAGFKISEESHRRFKLWCIRKNLDMSVIIEKLIEGVITEDSRIMDYLKDNLDLADLLKIERG